MNITPKSSNWSIQLSGDALKYLRQPVRNGISKLDAYLWLLDNTISRTDSYTPRYGADIILSRNELVVVVSDLVILWGWNQRTVCAFIDRLVELGLITAKENRKRYTLLSFAIDFRDGHQEHPFIYDMTKYDTISEAARLWLSGENTDNDAIEAVSEICETFSDPNGYQIDNLMQMYCFLRQVLKNVTHSMVEPPIHPDAKSCCLLKGFGANWGVFLEILGSDIDGMSFEQRNPADTSRPNITAEDRRIIEQLICHLWPDAHRDRI